MTLTDWLSSLASNLTESVSCSQPFDDPADVMIQVEAELIEATGYNLNHQRVSPTQE
jgi:hypothetical protein